MQNLASFNCNKENFKIFWENILTSDNFIKELKKFLFDRGKKRRSFKKYLLY